MTSVVVYIYSWAVVFTLAKASDISKGECPTTCTGKPLGTNQRWRDCNDCHSFKICQTNGMMATGTCPSGLFWNWRLDTPNCDTEGGCDDCITNCDGSPKDTNRRWRHCTDCTKYHQCTTPNGLETSACSPGLYWNWKLSTPNCDMTSEVCDSTVQNYVCGDDCDINTGSGLLFLPDCNCCNMYKTCFGTMSSSHTCTDGLAFSPGLNSCANQTEVDCGHRTIC